MKFSEFLEHRPPKPSHVYTFLCEDDLLVEESAPGWARIFGGESDWTFERISAKEFEALEPAALLEAALSPPLFGPTRALMVLGAGRLTKKSFEVLGEIAGLGASSIRVVLVVSSGKKPARSPFPAVAIDPVGPGDAARWLRKKYGIDVETARYLVDNLGCDLRLLASEMDKLTAYAGDERQVGIPDVDLLTLRVDQLAPFELEDAVMAGDGVRAIRLVEAMLAGGTEPLVVLARVARVWRQLMVGAALAGRASGRELAAAAGVPPWKAAELGKASERVSRSRIERGFSEMLRADRRFKTTAADPRVVLDLLLWSLLRSKERAEAARYAAS